MNLSQKREQPRTFRRETVEQILDWVAAGESCVVVGIGSVGKSNLLRSLQENRPDGTDHGGGRDDTLYVYVDVNKMLKRSLWGLWELMLHQLLIQLMAPQIDQGVRQSVDELHQRATDRETRYLALRHLDRAVSMVCRQLGMRLVFLIDEFDELCRALPARGYAALRALRDDHKYELMYVVASRLDLRRLQEDVPELEPFEELASPNTIWLGPYSEEDAESMLQRLEDRYGTSLDLATKRQLLLVSGGHPGLLRASFRVAVSHPDDLMGVLPHNWRVQDECRRIWLSLTSDEQGVMTRLASPSVTSVPTDETVKLLRRKGMIQALPQDELRVFSHLVAEFIQEKQPSVGGRIQIDRQRRIVFVDGREMRNLTKLEFKFIDYLAEKKGKPASRDELVQHLYPDAIASPDDGVTEQRLDSVVKRLRKRIEPVPGSPRYIVTVRGYGFRLDIGDDESAPASTVK